MSTKVPDFVRRAIEAQGKVDPDDVERKLELLERDDDPETLSPDKAALFDQPAPRPHWQDRDA